VLIAAFAGAVWLFPRIFYIVPLTSAEWIALAILASIVLSVQIAVGLTARILTKKKVRIKIFQEVDL